MKIFKNIESMKLILYFTSKNCPPCVILTPIMDELSNNYPIQKINVDENKELANQNNIQGVPTVVVFENEIEKQRLIGLKTKNEYIKAFES